MQIISEVEQVRARAANGKATDADAIAASVADSIKAAFKGPYNIRVKRVKVDALLRWKSVDGDNVKRPIVEVNVAIVSEQWGGLNIEL